MTKDIEYFWCHYCGECYEGRRPPGYAGVTEHEIEHWFCSKECLDNDPDHELLEHVEASAKHLDELLQDVSVMGLHDSDDDCHPEGYPWAVVDETGIRAYFRVKREAFLHRLSLINLRLNGPDVLDEMPEGRFITATGHDRRKVE